MKHNSEEHHELRASHRGRCGEVDDLGHQNGEENAVHTIMKSRGLQLPFVVLAGQLPIHSKQSPGYGSIVRSVLGILVV